MLDKVKDINFIDFCYYYLTPATIVTLVIYFIWKGKFKSEYKHQDLTMPTTIGNPIGIIDKELYESNDNDC